jgi:SAM-dependent methyltransferase
MSTGETFQIPLEAAEVYEARFVPAIFAEWAPLVVDEASVRPAQAVLDVACGTGIVARTVADRIGADGVVVGVDLNPAMLTVARRIRPDLEWQQADAADLPFPAGTFDAVLCQMALMFFPYRRRAVAEMARVSVTGGTVAVAVPAAIDDQPAYRRLVAIVAEEAGTDAASLLDAYWSCGDLDELCRLVESTGLRVTSVRTHLGTAKFGSPDELVATEVEGSPLVTRLSDDMYRRIKDRARAALEPFQSSDGSLPAPLRGHIVTARRD